MMDPTAKFSGLAADYQAFRPDYPPEVWARVSDALPPNKVETHQGASPPIAIDVGAGTGISTRQIAAALGEGFSIIGVEPNEDMRAQAESQQTPRVTYLDAKAEQLPLEDNTVSLVVAAQAAHWFDRVRFYAEVARLLVDGGVLAIMMNDRDWHASAFVDQYETYLENYGINHTRYYRDINFRDEMESSGHFQNVATHSIPWERRMTRDEFIGMALSSTMMRGVITNLGKPEALGRLAELIDQHFGPNEILVVPYRTELTIARRHPRS
jgi:SAM-dependent methyltransferase